MGLPGREKGTLRRKKEEEEGGGEGEEEEKEEEEEGEEEKQRQVSPTILPTHWPARVTTSSMCPFL